MYIYVSHKIYLALSFTVKDKRKSNYITYQAMQWYQYVAEPVE